LLAAPSTSVVSATPTAWLDNTHLYMTGFVPNSDAPPHNVYLIDTTKGSNQQITANERVITISNRCIDYDTSADDTKLFFSNCNVVYNLPQIDMQGPSSISLQSAQGGPQTTIYNSQSQAITTIRVISKNTILFIIHNTAGVTNQNGLWIMNTNGSGSKQLMATSTAQYPTLNPFSQYTWSNVSRDGNMYALKISNQNLTMQSLSIGSIAGSKASVVAQFTGNGNINIVGWTKM
jgi:hypothetical protein